MQAFGLSLIKGRLGSNQDRCEIQTPPERRNRPAAKARRSDPSRPRLPAKVSKTMNAAAVANERLHVRGRLAGVQNDGIKSSLMPTKPMQDERSGRRPGVGSAPRSRQARRRRRPNLVKAGLRPPPPAASALTRLCSSPSGAAREIEGRTWASIPFPHFPAAIRQQRKNARNPIDKMPPYEPGHDDAAVVLYPHRASR